MGWILIIGLGGVGVTSVEFASEAACRIAGQAMAKEWSRGAILNLDQIRWVCVPEGDATKATTGK
jgi:hypothetical protein